MVGLVHPLVETRQMKAGFVLSASAHGGHAGVFGCKRFHANDTLVFVVNVVRRRIVAFGLLLECFRHFLGHLLLEVRTRQDNLLGRNGRNFVCRLKGRCRLEKVLVSSSCCSFRSGRCHDDTPHGRDCVLVLQLVDLFVMGGSSPKPKKTFWWFAS